MQPRTMREISSPEAPRRIGSMPPSSRSALRAGSDGLAEQEIDPQPLTGPGDLHGDARLPPGDLEAADRLVDDALEAAGHHPDRTDDATVDEEPHRHGSVRALLLVGAPRDGGLELLALRRGGDHVLVRIAAG